ncbi:MAG TPA: LamG domain-containing protein, partial [Catalimonadaceae bacterium]|nr:LamG domain-containing protein [Catalimonadaceae bacterium]
MKNRRVLFLIVFAFLFCNHSFGQLTFWNNLELYYPFNNNALDYSGNGWDATPIDVIPTEGVFGDPNGAYHFNGSTSRVLRNVLSIADSSTFSCWIYSELDSQAAPIIYNGHTAHAGFGVFIKKPYGNFGSGYRGKTLVVHQGGVSESYFNNSFEVPTQQWLHLALVRRGQTIELYLNGIFQASAPYVANTPYGEFSLGASTDHITVGYPAFMGKIDEVMVFTSALSAQNVYKVFQVNLTDTKDLIGNSNN